MNKCIFGASLKEIKNILKERWTFFLPALTFLAFGTVFLWLNPKVEGHIWINQIHSPFFDNFFKYSTHLGDGLMGIVIIIAFIFYSYKRAYFIFLCYAIANLVTLFLKYVVFPHVYRPTLELYDYFRYDELAHLVLENNKVATSFPSGHTTTAFAIFGSLAILYKGKVLGLTFAILAIIAGFSRVYLSQHFLEDVVAGGTISIIFILVVYKFFPFKEGLQSNERKGLIEIFNG